MINEENEKGKCTGCGACSCSCPVSAVSMKEDDEGFAYPVIDKELCINCGVCERVCPVGRQEEKKGKKIQAFSAYSRDLESRMRSTSGGIFTEIARMVINKWKGTVYGVAFTEDYLGVEYRAALQEKEIRQFNGSKYLQADSGRIYLEIENQLREGRTVLFSGLPCQIAGLKSFLKKDYIHLFCIDMVCFGVPSPLVWLKYIEAFWKEDKMEEVVFKDKMEGWKNWMVKLASANTVVYESGNVNSYMKSFLRGINVRPSCFQCEFKGLERISDLTIADCWGIAEHDSELNDNRGLSAVLIQSEKGEKLWNETQGRIVWKRFDPDDLMRGNWAAINCIKESPERDIFFEKLKSGNTMEAFKAIDGRKY